MLATKFVHEAGPSVTTLPLAPYLARRPSAATPPPPGLTQYACPRDHAEALYTASARTITRPSSFQAASRRPLPCPVLVPSPFNFPHIVLPHALNVFLPLDFLRNRSFRPERVRSRLRNPCLRIRTSREGLFMFVARRGPHRICVAPSAGCAVIADLGTTSDAAVSADSPVVVGVKVVVWRRVVGRRLKMLAPLLGKLGRRVGREEKDL